MSNVPGASAVYATCRCGSCKNVVLGSAMDAGDTERFNPMRPPVAAVRAALDALLAESRLRLSERNRRFLAFVVSEALAGRGDRIKAYAVGVDVFGRGADFDPTTDPIVRIEATRIRSALSSYYDEFGFRDQVRIMIPPGSYAPVFSYLSPEGQPPQTQRNGGPSIEIGDPISVSASGTRRSVVVLSRARPHNRSTGGGLELLKQTLAARLRAMNVRVFVMPRRERRAAAEAVDRLLLHPDTVYLLDVTLHSPLGDYKMWCTITDGGTGELLDSLLIERKSEDASDPATMDEIAEQAGKMVERILSLN
jgi:hypothetical protein